MKKVKLLIIFLCMICLCSACSSYSKEEKMILEGLSKIQDNLLDPNSVIAYKCYLWPCNSWENAKAEAEEQDEIAVYYYIGATNRSGGITDEVYVAVFDKAGKYLGHSNETTYEKWVDNSNSVDIHPDVQGQFLNVSFWQSFGWPDYATDYTSFLKEEVNKK